MGKYSLGKSTAHVGESIIKTEISINEAKSNALVKNIDKQLDSVSSSLHKINNILNRSVSLGAIKGTKANSFKSWAKKSKSQADNATKIKDKLDIKYAEDVRNYPIKLLDQKIAELEKRIESMRK